MCGSRSRRSSLTDNRAAAIPLTHIHTHTACVTRPSRAVVSEHPGGGGPTAASGREEEEEEGEEDETVTRRRQRLLRRRWEC